MDIANILWEGGVEDSSTCTTKYVPFKGTCFYSAAVATTIFKRPYSPRTTCTRCTLNLCGEFQGDEDQWKGHLVVGPAVLSRRDNVLAMPRRVGGPSRAY
jgi:hypothetical protein